MKKNSKAIKKDALISKIAKKAGISAAKAKTAYECVLKESPAFRQQSVKTVKAKDQVLVKVAAKPIVKKVELKKSVPVEKKVEIIKTVEVIKEVPVVVVKEVIKEVKVVKEVPVEVIKEVTLVTEVVDDSGMKALSAKCASLEKDLKAAKLGAAKAEADFKKKLAVKPKTVIQKVEVIKEVPVEIIKEVEVVKSIDMDMLKKMMGKVGTVQVSKKVVGTTTNVKEGKIVSRKEVEPGASTKVTGKRTVSSKKTAKKAAPKKATAEKGGPKKATATKAAPKKVAGKKEAVKKDDLKKIEGVGPAIEKLLHKAGISTFKKLSTTKADSVKKILDGGGSKFQMHDPTSWGKQAGLAASGKWADLKKLQDKLNGGK